MIHLIIGFEQFWDQVPNKIAKGYARECFYRALKKASFEEVITGLPGYHKYEQKRMNQEGYKPLHPSTWLNQERWADSLGYNAPVIFRGEINLADGSCKRFKGVSQEDIDSQIAAFILKNSLESKTSHKGYKYYERISE